MIGKPLGSEGKSMKTIEEMIKELPPEIQQEVKDFVEFLLEKRVKRSRGKPRFDWAGTLKHLGEQYTSVELQHKISDWRAGEK
jgi:hypothetical protein